MPINFWTISRITIRGQEQQIQCTTTICCCQFRSGIVPSPNNPNQFLHPEKWARSVSWPERNPLFVVIPYFSGGQATNRPTLRLGFISRVGANEGTLRIQHGLPSAKHSCQRNCDGKGGRNKNGNEEEKSDGP